MAVPVALVAFAVASALSAVSTIYSTEVNTRSQDAVSQYTSGYELGAMLENERYFKDYLAKHHIADRGIKYPYRTGVNFNQSRYFKAEANIMGNKASRLSAYTRGASSLFGLYGQSRVMSRGGGRKPMSSFYYGRQELYW